MSASSRRAFGKKLRELGFSTYEDYLQSDHWADVRRRFSESKLHKGRCYACPRTYPLNLHHMTYARLGREHLNDLVMLCQDCHRAAHDLEIKRGVTLRGATKMLIHETWWKLGSRPRGIGPPGKKYQRRLAKLARS